MRALKIQWTSWNGCPAPAFLSLCPSDTCFYTDGWIRWSQGHLNEAAGQWAATRHMLGHSREPLRDGMTGLCHNTRAPGKSQTGISVPPRYTSISHTMASAYRFTVKYRHSRRRSLKAPSTIAQQNSEMHFPGTRMPWPQFSASTVTSTAVSSHWQKEYNLQDEHNLLCALRTVLWAAGAFLIVIPLDLLLPGPNSGMLGFTLKEQSCDFCSPTLHAITGTELPTRYQELEKAWGCWSEHPSKGSQLAPSYPHPHSLLPGLLTEPPQLLSSVSLLSLISQYNSSKA